MPPKHNNIPIFIPELACPHRCVFCNQEKISATSKAPQPAEIKRLIEKYLCTIPDENEVEIAFFGGSFTGIPVDLQEAYLQAAYPYIASGRVCGIRISTRPDYICQEILQLLKKYSVTSIELGAQSTDADVLRQSGRGHDAKAIENASQLILNEGFELGLQMMIGLPRDSFEKSEQTAKDIIRLGAHTTRIYPTLVIKNTPLEQLYLRNEYLPLSLEDAVSQTKKLVKIFEENRVTILRTGLHPSEELTPENSLLAGPFHPSFKELVMTEIWGEILSEKLKNSRDNVRIFVAPSQFNFAIGYRAKNKKMLIAKGLHPKFCQDTELKKYQIRIEKQ